MRVSFNSWEEDYLGDYIQEYKKVGLLLNKKSIEEILKHRQKMIDGEVLKINITDTHFFEHYLLFEEHSTGNKRIGWPIVSDFHRIKSGITNSNEIYNSEFEEIIEAIVEVNDALKAQGKTFDEQIWEDHLEDAMLIVAYAKHNIFSRVFETRYRKALSEKQKKNIRNFYAAIADNKKTIEVDNIVVKYNEDGQAKRLKIDSPILLKMMLYEFAKKYYKFIEREDEETWESRVVFYKEKTLSGSPGYDYTKYLASLIRVYNYIFVDNTDLFENVNLKWRYFLLGKLLTIAGYSRYSEDKGDYLDEADYYYKKLKIKAVLDGTE